MATREEKAMELMREEEEREERAKSPKHKVTVVQTYTVLRTIAFDVRGLDHADAVEQVRRGNVDVPEFNDPRWKDIWDLTDEEYIDQK